MVNIDIYLHLIYVFYFVLHPNLSVY